MTLGAYACAPSPLLTGILPVEDSILRRTGQLHSRHCRDLRYAIAQSEVTHTPLHVLSLDFREAFDRITHRYQYTILTAYGLHECFIDRIRYMHQDATSFIQINGHITGTIALWCSVREGCPFSMALFAFCLNPLLHLLDTRLKGIRSGSTGHRIAVVNYADDVTFFVTRNEEFRFIRDVVQHCVEASGAHLNMRKSKALVVGRRKGNENDLGLDFVPNARILGIAFSNTMDGQPTSASRELLAISRARLSGRTDGT